MRRLIFFFLLSLALLLPLTAAAFSLGDMFQGKTGSVPRAANEIAQSLDKQMARYLDPQHGRASISIACTVPALLGDLNQSSPLARQMSEEITRWLVQEGYSVDEMRKANQITMAQERGEFLLTRDTRRLAQHSAASAAILTGTYTLTAESVRFNIRLVSATDNRTMAMATATVPVTAELAPLLADSAVATTPLAPSVRTRLKR